MLYDHFLGDINCVHLIAFSLMDALDEQLAQVIFWLNFVKSRIPLQPPLGKYHFFILTCVLCPLTLCIVSKDMLVRHKSIRLILIKVNVNCTWLIDCKSFCIIKDFKVG